jgi:hypothetical protein
VSGRLFGKSLNPPLFAVWQQWGVEVSTCLIKFDLPRIVYVNGYRNSHKTKLKIQEIFAMQQFINGDNAQFGWLQSQIQENLIIFPDEPLPDSCIPNRSRIGFEFTETNGFKLYIDKNISFTGEHPNFAAWLANGEASFNTYDDMVAFIKELGCLFEDSPQPASESGDSEQSQDSPEISEQPQSDTEDSEQSQNDPFSLTYSVTSPLGSLMTFKFKYEKVEPEDSGHFWRAFIVESPDYGSRSTSAPDTHRMTNTDGRYYVDWRAGRHCNDWHPEPARLDDITQASKLWAEGTAKYIDTGSFA